MKYRSWGIALALTVSGCASNGFNQYYAANPSVSSEQISERRVAPAPAEPEVVHGGDPKVDMAALESEGYIVVGHSSFNGPAANDLGAIAKGKELGAEKVLIYANYAGTVNTFIPMQTPTTQFSTTNVSGTISGPGGVAAVSGMGTTTTYGTETTNIPVSINRYQHLAVYMVRVKYAFGAHSRNLTSEEAKIAGSVNGASITAVVIGSPAAAAGILPGDVVTKVDTVDVLDAKQLNAYLNGRQGESVKMYVVRNGTKSVKTVKLNTI